jgi:hypothetical protein
MIPLPVNIVDQPLYAINRRESGPRRYGSQRFSNYNHAALSVTDTRREVTTCRYLTLNIAARLFLCCKPVERAVFGYILASCTKVTLATWRPQLALRVRELLDSLGSDRLLAFQLPDRSPR